jgi:hypothetical protein
MIIVNISNLDYWDVVVPSTYVIVRWIYLSVFSHASRRLICLNAWTGVNSNNVEILKQRFKHRGVRSISRLWPQILRKDHKLELKIRIVEATTPP